MKEEGGGETKIKTKESRRQGNPNKETVCGFHLSQCESPPALLSKARGSPEDLVNRRWVWGGV